MAFVGAHGRAPLVGQIRRRRTTLQARFVRLLHAFRRGTRPLVRRSLGEGGCLPLPEFRLCSRRRITAANGPTGTHTHAYRRAAHSVPALAGMRWRAVRRGARLCAQHDPPPADLGGSLLTRELPRASPLALWERVRVRERSKPGSACGSRPRRRTASLTDALPPP